MAPSTAGSRGKRADAEFRLPADSAYLAVLRTATAAVAARLDFTVDDIEDLRIAVDEACALLLPQADEAADLHCRFDLRPGRLVVTVAVDSRHPAHPGPRELRLDGAGRADRPHRGRVRRRSTRLTSP